MGTIRKPTIDIPPPAFLGAGASGAAAGGAGEDGAGEFAALAALFNFAAARAAAKGLPEEGESSKNRSIFQTGDLARFKSKYIVGEIVDGQSHTVGRR